MKIGRIALINVGALVLFVSCSCTSGNENRGKAQEIWKFHEAVVTNAAEGDAPYTDQFERSIDFFREVAGIEIRVEIYTMGYMPTAETAQDLELVRSWFQENGDRLYFDPESRSVRVLEEK